MKNIIFQVQLVVHVREWDSSVCSSGQLGKRNEDYKAKLIDAWHPLMQEEVAQSVFKNTDNCEIQ